VTGEPVIALEGVTFSYDGSPVLEDVHVEVDREDFACIVGPNGGGKTTLLKLVLGLLQPARGKVRVFGVAPAEARARMGYVPQSYAYDAQFPVRVLDVVLMGRVHQSRWLGPYTRADKEAAAEALRQVKILDLRHRPLASLSGGQRQRAVIARALISQPELLLLDEPTASLDLAFETELYALLAELNKRMTVVMVSHDVGFVSGFISKVICVKRSVVVHPTSEITGEMIQEMYGSDVRMVRHDHFHPPGDAHG
jgi:zinc transport system ATP-binding protein